jgi:hypothetical protein
MKKYPETIVGLNITRTIYSGVLLYLCIALYVTSLIACNENRTPTSNLFDPQKVAYVVGTEFVDSKKIDSYRQIFWYYVDYENNLYVGDQQNKRIDKFNKYGQYEVSFGGPGQGPGEISMGFPLFCADSQGYVFSSFMGSICVYNKEGKYIEDIAYPDDFKHHFCARISADHNDDLVIALRSSDNEYKYFKFVRKDRSFNLFHTDSKRRGIYQGFFQFTPGYDFDGSNNIYVLDSIENKIYLFDSSGKSLRTIERRGAKNRITEKELFRTTVNHVIEKVPASYLDALTGDSQYFPINFGINIDKDLVFIWKSEKDTEYKYVIEIFDSNFKLLGNSAFYNVIQNNMVYMRNGFVYFLNIGDEDREFKKRIGKISIFNLPYKVICYKYDF